MASTLYLWRKSQYCSFLDAERCGGLRSIDLLWDNSVSLADRSTELADCLEAIGTARDMIDPSEKFGYALVAEGLGGTRLLLDCC
jgi:hypothetical protein